MSLVRVERQDGMARLLLDSASADDAVRSIMLGRKGSVFCSPRAMSSSQATQSECHQRPCISCSSPGCRSPHNGSEAAIAGLQKQFGELEELSAHHFDSAEGREGLAAFAEKRSPNWVLSPLG